MLIPEFAMIVPETEEAKDLLNFLDSEEIMMALVAKGSRQEK